MRRYFWPVFLVFTLVIRFFFQGQPAWAEQWYSRGIFQGVRCALDYLTGWIPFPVTYILFGGVLWVLYRGGRQLFQRDAVSWLRRLQHAGWQLLQFVCGTVTLFYWMWGFNYNRIPLEEAILLPQITVNADTIRSMFYRQTQIVLDLRLQLQPDTAQLMPLMPDKTALESQVRSDVEQLLQTMGYPVVGRVRGREPFWDGFLLRFGASGIYNPFTGESNMDGALYDLSKPYVLAHEFGHGYGFGDEGVCNFIGYLSMSRSANLYCRYSAELGFWRELASVYRRLEPETYVTFRAQLPSGFLGDLEKIYERLDKYPEFFSSFRRAAYDQYLKAQGIEEGMKNYDKVIGLVAAWRKRD